MNSSDHSSSIHGVTGEWLAEAGEATEIDIPFRKVEMHARKLGVFTRSSSEVLADGLSFEEQIGESMRSGLSWWLDYSFLQGSGSGQPLGILNADSRVTADAEAGQAPGTITYQNVCTMLSRLAPACWSRAIWIAHPSCIPSLLGLTVVIGTSGSHIPVLSQDGGTFTMLGREVLFSEKMNALGDEGDLLLVDPSQYAIALRKEIVLERSQHVYWSTDQVAWRAILRCDGQPLWESAFTPKSGDDQSWAVTLEAR